MQDQENGGHGPHAAVEREGEIEAEGRLHPMQAGGQDHLHDEDGKSQQGKAAAKIIIEYVVGLQVEGRHHQQRRKDNGQVQDDPGAGPVHGRSGE